MEDRTAKIDQFEVSAYRIPTDGNESDGTLDWDHTDIVVVQIGAAGKNGLGWSYAPKAAGEMIQDILKHVVVGQSPLAIEGIWREMNGRLRNAGRPGAGCMAVAAVDVALWDLKAKILEISLVDLLGPVREAVNIYGSGGFTNLSNGRLAQQLGTWASQGIRRVKMKVGRDAAADIERVKVARKAIGGNVELFVDANGAYEVKQALAMAVRFAEENVTWFEEPRPSDDLRGLALIRQQVLPGMEIAAGEYGDKPEYFRRMLSASAVDCLQADVTRCGGYTGFLKVAALCDAFETALSAHCAPQLHAHIGCAVAELRHVEYFHDHVRIEQLLFDGILSQQNGTLTPDRSRPGHGMVLKSAEAAKYRV